MSWMEWMVLFDVDDSVDGNNEEEALGVVSNDDGVLFDSNVDAAVVFFVVERAEDDDDGGSDGGGSGSDSARGSNGSACGEVIACCWCWCCWIGLFVGDSMWLTIGLDEQQLALVVRLVDA